MVASAASVRVTGLNELVRALKQVDSGLPKEMRGVSLSVAQTVTEQARSRGFSLGSVAAKAAPSLRASGRQAGAGVTVGGSAYPWALGAEFGGQGRPTTQQFQPHLGRTGYFVYPTIRDNQAEIEEAYADGVDALLRKAGLL